MISPFDVHVREVFMTLIFKYTCTFKHCGTRLCHTATVRRCRRHFNKELTESRQRQLIAAVADVRTAYDRKALMLQPL